MTESTPKPASWRKFAPSELTISIIVIYIVFHLAWALFRGDDVLKFALSVTRNVIESTVRNFGIFFRDALGIPNFELPVVIAALLVGRWLYMFRCRKPKWYGLVEILTGLFIATFIVGQINGTMVQSGASIDRYAAPLFTALGALYIVVRGYDNMYRSVSGEDRRRWNLKFFGKDTDEKL